MVADSGEAIFIGQAKPGGEPQTLNLRRANRHGLIAGQAFTRIKSRMV